MQLPFFPYLCKRSFQKHRGTTIQKDRLESISSRSSSCHNSTGQVLVINPSLPATNSVIGEPWLTEHAPMHSIKKIASPYPTPNFSLEGLSTGIKPVPWKKGVTLQVPTQDTRWLCWPDSIFNSSRLCVCILWAYDVPRTKARTHSFSFGYSDKKQHFLWEVLLSVRAIAGCSRRHHTPSYCFCLPKIAKKLEQVAF